MGYEIVLSRVAESDLAQIIEYIARDNPAAAARFGRELGGAYPRATEFSRDWPRRAKIPDRDARELIHGSYRIVYQINERKKVIEIARFWHAARGTPQVGS